MTRYYQALLAYQRGCNSSEDIAAELNISKAFASLLTTQLCQDGIIKRTGRRLPRRESLITGPRFSRFNAMTAFVYEYVPEQKGLAPMHVKRYMHRLDVPYQSLSAYQLLRAGLRSRLSQKR